jgi:hypothetical protein
MTSRRPVCRRCGRLLDEVKASRTISCTSQILFAETYPAAELILMGVEEPRAVIHAPNGSVDPTEISSMALTAALFLQRYVAAPA